MDARRFDGLARALAVPRSRRAAFRGGGLGLAGLAFGLLAARRPASAQEATPVDVADPTEYLFVQTFAAGTFTPAETGDTYVLTLTGGTGQTIYFAERPQRFVGTVPTENFLDGNLFDPTNPPNAAIVAQTPEGEDILVVELTDPTVDATTGTVTYEARPLAEYQGDGLVSLAQRQADDELPAALGPVSLFIDDAACLPDGAFAQWLYPDDTRSLQEQEAACAPLCCSGACHLGAVEPFIGWVCAASS